MTNPVNPFASNGAAPNPGGASFVIPNMDHIEDKATYTPPGLYPATVTGFRIMQSQAGNQMLEFTLSVHTQNGDLKKRFFCPTSSNALWKLKKIARALSLAQGSIDANLVIGRKCTANIIDDGEYQGNPDCSIEMITPPSNVAGLTTTGDDQVPF